MRRAAERAETALAGLERPLGRYLLELEADQAEGRSWYGEPGRAELVEWQPVLKRAGVHASPVRVAQAYLELAVLVRALEGLATAARMRSAPEPSASGRASSTFARTSSTAAASKTCEPSPPCKAPRDASASSVSRTAAVAARVDPADAGRP